MNCRSLAPLLALLAAACTKPPAAAPPRLHKQTRFALGPVAVSIQAVSARTKQADRAIDAAFAAIAQVNNLASSYLPQSEISRFNTSRDGAVHLSAQTVAILRRAHEISELTGGAFDVTAAPLIRLWKQTIESQQPPDAAQLDAAKKLVGYKALVLGPNSVKANTPGMHIDLGGIAKGYAIDQAVDALKANGIANALVDAGGDGYALGTRPDGTPWRLGVQDPDKPKETARLGGLVLVLSHTAYATSGDYQQFVEIDGVRYAHIIDPRTGRPARKAASVTVIAPDCTTADALATAVSVLGVEPGLALINKLPRVECMILTRDGAGGLKIDTSTGFQRHVQPE